ncbi:hypothetical protein WR25_16609 [Diploscapter pachys]|uniref:Neurotransmitter-gated ion-channel ligand-binding domain-containing protein n=1 Tax=Diploscapter pachys TaxID=2018661 RepID=A0A2A2KXI2_9BILA|nr:hypothetical protein WR25_16609 [Diploscapter pachys]
MDLLQQQNLLYDNIFKGYYSDLPPTTRLSESSVNDITPDSLNIHLILCYLKLVEIILPEEKISLIMELDTVNSNGTIKYYRTIVVETVCNFNGNGEWRILNMDIVSDNGLPSIRLVLKRNPSFYICLMILPTFVINLLTIYGLFIEAADDATRVRTNFVLKESDTY